MKPKLIISLLLVMVVIVVSSCTTTTVCNPPYINFGQSCCLDQNADAMCDDVNNESITDDSSLNDSFEPVKVVKNESVLRDEQENLDYNLINKLQKKINQFTYNDASWIQTSRDSSYYDLGSQKLATLHVLPAPVADSVSYEKNFSGIGWRANLHYLNSTAYDHLFSPMNPAEIENKALAKKYSQEVVFVERYVDEQAIETPLGYVLEYQERNWKRDEYKYFKGTYQNNILVYKIFCSPTLVVYLQPSRDDLDLNLLTSTLENADEVWNQNVVRLRPEMLQKAQKVMQECPNSAAMTKTLKGSVYSKHTTYADHLPTYLYYYFDVDIKMDPEVHRSELHTQKNAIDKVTVTLRNNEIYDIDGPLLIDIRVKPEGSVEEYLVRDKKLTGRFAAGTTIDRVFIPFEPIEFDSKATVEVRMYTENGGYYIRPQTFVIDY